MEGSVVSRVLCALCLALVASPAIYAFQMPALEPFDEPDKLCKLFSLDNVIYRMYTVYEVVLKYF